MLLLLSLLLLLLFCLVWFGLVWFGLVWFGLVWFSIVIKNPLPLTLYSEIILLIVWLIQLLEIE